MSMTGKAKLVTVFGGSGFIGRNVVRRLAQQGYRVRVAVRKPNLAHFLRPLGDVGQISLVQANLRDADSIIRATEGADAVINLVGLRVESGTQKFSALHHQGALWVAQAAERAKVPTFIHVSGPSVDPDSESKYASTKGKGEQAVRDVRPDAILIRPSTTFGSDDTFLNRFASMARLLPVLPLIAGGETKFQPVYVGDVADAIVNAVGAKNIAGKTFELGGPAIYTMKELLTYVCEQTERNRPLIPMPLGLAKLEARFIGLLPNPPLTVDEVLLLAEDHVVSEDPEIGTIADLGVTDLKTMEAIAPTYLWRYRRTGEFASGHAS